ncbi:MAG: TonB family protein [Rubrivivax sp.]|nr:TonB family protein [Rubrivivax sp.]
MSAAALSFRQGVLPWTAGTDDDHRFQRIQRWVIGSGLLLCLVIPWLPVTTPEPPPPPEPPARVAKLLLPPPAIKPITPPAPAPKAETPKAPTPTLTAEKPRPAPASVAEARNPVPNKPPGETLEAARRKAQGVGLLAMKDQLQQLSAAPVAVQMAPVKPGPGIGTGSGPGVGAGTEPGIPTRAMITAAASRGSGGIASGGVSRDTGGGGLAGRATTLVEGSIGGGGGGGPGGGTGGGSAARGDGTGSGKAAAAAAGGELKRSGSGKASRSIEEIRLVFERHKGAIYALYNRALRDEPALQGKVVLELRIAPGGDVADIRVVSSELGAAELERKLLARVRQFDFGAKDVEVMVVSWPVDFLPS